MKTNSLNKKVIASLALFGIVVGMIAPGFYLFTRTSVVYASDWVELSSGQTMIWNLQWSFRWYLSPGDLVVLMLRQGRFSVDPAHLLFNVSIFQFVDSSILADQVFLFSTTYSMAQLLRMYNGVINLHFNSPQWYDIRLYTFINDSLPATPGFSSQVISRSSTDIILGGSLIAGGGILLLAGAFWVLRTFRRERSAPLMRDKPASSPPSSQVEALGSKKL